MLANKMMMMMMIFVRIFYPNYAIVINKPYTICILHQMTAVACYTVHFRQVTHLVFYISVYTNHRTEF